METREWQEENVPEDNRQCLPSSKLQYTHVIKRGVTDVEYYGLKLAMNTCYPRHIIDNAITLSQTLMKDRGVIIPVRIFHASNGTIFSLILMFVTVLIRSSKNIALTMKQI